MSGPKIRVGLDVDGLRNDLDKLEEAGKRVNEAINNPGASAGFDPGKAKREALNELLKVAEDLADKLGEIGEQDIIDVDALKAGIDALQKATDTAGKLEKTLYGTTGKRTSGVSKALDEFKALEAHMRRVQRAQEALHRHGLRLTQKEVEAKKAAYDKLAKSGMFGTRPLSELGFDEFLNNSARLNPKLRRLVQDEIGLPTGQEGHRGRSFVGELGRTAGLNVMNAVVPGNAGTSILNSATRQALATEGGLLSGRGLAMLGAGAGIGAAAYGVVRAVQGVRQAMNDAEAEAVTLSELRRSLGMTAAEFDTFRSSVRELTDGFGIAYNEAANLARSLGHASGVVDGDLQTGAGFARGYGIDPAQGVGFFGEMRHMGAARTEADSRRLALMIGEAVNRGGTANRMDEVLSAIESFTSMAARQALAAPNVGGYASMLSSLTAQEYAGLHGDPINAGQMLAAADASIRRGGAFGEASQNFTLGILQRELPGVSGLDLSVISEQGAFGTVSGAFGEHSPAYQMARAVGDQAALERYRRMVAADDGRTNLARALGGLEAQSGGDVDMFRKAVAGHLGLSETQAAALVNAYRSDTGLGGLESRLRGAGVDVSSLNARSIAPLAELLRPGNQAGVMAQWEKLSGMKAVSAEEKAAVEKDMAEGGYSDSVVNAIIRLTAKYDTAEDEGSRARKAQIDLANEFQNYAKELLPLTASIKEGIVELVRALPEALRPDETNEYLKRMDRERAATEAAKVNAAAGVTFSGVSGTGEALTENDLKRARAAVGALTYAGTSPEDRRKTIERYRESYQRSPGLFPKEFPEFLERAEQNLDHPERISAPPAEAAPAAAPSRRPAPEMTIPAEIPPASRRGAVDQGTIRELLRERGYTDAQAAGIIGNLMQESSLVPDIRGDRGSAYGLAQWRGERLEGLRRYAADAGTDISDPRTQVGYLDHELRTGERAAGDALRAAQTPRDAAVAMLSYERPRGWTRGNPLGGDAAAERIRYAEQAMPKEAPAGEAWRFVPRETMPTEALPAEGKPADWSFIPRETVRTDDPFGAQIPPSRREEPQGGRHNFNFSHSITLQDPRGNPLVDPIIQTHVGPPVPAGASR